VGRAAELKNDTAYCSNRKTFLNVIVILRVLLTQHLYQPMYRLMMIDNVSSVIAFSYIQNFQPTLKKNECNPGDFMGEF
jgi:hypothetical protein